MQKQSLQISDFNMLSLIGIGNYAKVVLVRKKSSGKLYGMKILKKRKSSGFKDSSFLKNQAFIQKEILSKCQHPFIIKMHGTFQHNQRLYYILQYCPGGELFGVIKRNIRLSEENTKFYAAQIFLALQYLHSQNFIYRDLKPENILIDKQGYIRLVDFGLSCYRSNGKSNSQAKFAGTPQYLAPQSFSQKQSISTSIDWWSFGSIIFQLTVGFPPFYHQNQSMIEMKEKIIKDEKFLDYINSPILKDLLQKLLNKDPLKRLGYRKSTQIKNHAWFSNMNWQKIVKKQITAPFVPELKSEEDIRWFDMQNQFTMTPPQNLNQNEKNQTQKYNSFSLSWKSSKSPSSPLQSSASPVQQIQIHIKIEQNKDITKENQISQPPK